jgi:copper chaperone
VLDLIKASKVKNINILGGIKMKKKILVEGMSCGHCVNHVKEALEELKGVEVLDVTLETNSAKVDLTNSDVSDEDIKAIIDEYGYKVVGIEVL